MIQSKSLKKKQPLKKKLKKALIMAGSIRLLRDSAAFGIPRFIFRTKSHGRRIIWKSSAEQREITARKYLPEMIPKENKHFYFALSKRYPYIKGKKRWEKYYDLPSMEDVFHGKMNRRMKKLMAGKKISLEELIEKCSKAYEELNQILEKYRNQLELDLAPDQLMVDMKNGKVKLILIDI